MIGILTGTFDPVHDGHVAIARAALGQCGLQEVWLMVNPDPAHKLCQAGFDDRLAMVALALRAAEGLRLAPLEAGLAIRPHTLDTFLEVQRLWPAESLAFIVGLDTLFRLDTWKDVESVVKSTSYIAVHRPGTSVAGLVALRARLGPLGERLQVEVIEAETPSEVSSTQIRQQVAAGEAPQGVAPAVRQYIEQHQLYR